MDEKEKTDEKKSEENIKKVINRTLLEWAIDTSKEYFQDGTKRVGRLIYGAKHYANKTGEYMLGNEIMLKIRSEEERRIKFHSLLENAILIGAIATPLFFFYGLSNIIKKGDEERRKAALEELYNPAHYQTKQTNYFLNR